MAKKIPGWMEALLIKAMKEYLPPEAISEAFAAWRDEMIAWAKAQVASTSNKIDDVVVEKLADALTLCKVDDGQFLCELVVKGEHAVVDLLRTLSKSTETKLDDAAVDILEQALLA